jgi:hypothetical protein
MLDESQLRCSRIERRGTDPARPVRVDLLAQTQRGRRIL